MLQFTDLTTQQNKIRTQLEAAINKVLDHGKYILGPEVTELEEELAKFCGAKYAVTCANGTDALVLALKVKQVGVTDAIFVPSFTFAATAEAVVLAGAQPVLVDVLPDTYNLDPTSVAQAIKTAQAANLNPVGIITVDLFGQPADYAGLEQVAKEHGLWIIADAAQSFGATYEDRKVGNIVDLTTTSFFPSKPLGCYGDGGAIFTNDLATVELIKSLRMHGQDADSKHKYIGYNSRLDTLQAAILLEKLKIFPAEIAARQKIANSYSQNLMDFVQVPYVLPNATSVWAQYTVRLPAGVDRDLLINQLAAANIPARIYYAIPLYKQAAYKNYLTATGGSLPVCDQLAGQVLSLPMSGYVAENDVIFVCEHIQKLTKY